MKYLYPGYLGFGVLDRYGGGGGGGECERLLRLFVPIILFRMKVEFDIPDAVLIIVLNMDEHA